MTIYLNAFGKNNTICKYLPINDVNKKKNKLIIRMNYVISSYEKKSHY